MITFFAKAGVIATAIAGVIAISGSIAAVVILLVKRIAARKS